MAMLYPSLISGRGTIGTNTEAWPAILRGFMLKPSNCAVTVGECERTDAGQGMRKRLKWQCPHMSIALRSRLTIVMETRRRPVTTRDNP